MSLLRSNKLRLVDSNTYPLSGTNERFVHLATVTGGLRDFMCFIDERAQKVYIEEITGGSLEFINDELLVEDIAHFLNEHNLLDPRRTIR